MLNNHRTQTGIVKRSQCYLNSLRVWQSFDVSMLILLTSVFLSVHGQDTQTNRNKADQNLKSAARVNPSTLAMEFSLPLRSYPGRGGSSLPVFLNYSSKVWNIELINSRFESSQVAPGPGYNYEAFDSTDSMAMFATGTSAGWTSSLRTIAVAEQYYLYDQYGELFSGLSPMAYAQSLDEPEEGWSCSLIHWRMVPVSTATCIDGLMWYSTEFCVNQTTGDFRIVEDSGCWHGGYPPPAPAPTPVPREPQNVERIRLRMADNSTQEFRKSDQIFDCEDTPTNCDFEIDGTYLAVDGSGMRFVKGELQPGDIKQDVLYTPDGGKYYFQIILPANQALRLATKYVDANGNVHSFNTTNRTWSDTLGRSIKDPLPNPALNQYPVAGTQAVSLPTVDGLNSEYSIDWAPLSAMLEEPATTSLKYVGQDKCTNTLPDPVTGPSLFQNQPISALDDRIENDALWHYRKRACAVTWGTPHLFNPVVMSAVTLQDGQKYRFLYNEYGEITKITYPTGAYERFEYEYLRPMGVTALEVYTQANRGVKRHFISEDGVNELIPMEYTEISDSFGYTLRTETPDGMQSERALYESLGSGWGFEDPRNGMVKEERVKDTNGVLRSRTLTDWEARGPQGTGAYQHAKRDPRVRRSVSIMFEPGSNSALATMSVNEYDGAGSAEPEHFAHLNVKRTINYHAKVLTKADVDDEQITWSTIESWFANVPIASATETDYVYDAGYKARGIPSLPVETRVLNPINLDWPALAKSQIVYDNALPNSSSGYTYAMQTHGTGNSMDCSSDPQNPAICWQNPNGASGGIDLAYRGLPTTSRAWDAGSSSWIETHTRYDQFGNAVQAKDPIGNEETTEFSADYKYAYPTKAISPAPDPTNTHGTDQMSTAETTYDFTTGLPLTVKDDFGQISVTEYDAILRPFRVNPIVVNGVATGPKTETVYGVPNASGQLPADQRFVKVRKQIDANNWDEAITWFDGLGRTIKTQAKDSQGDVIVDTYYDEFGRVQRVSNPYRAGDTVYWSKTRYDAAGRAVESYAPATLADVIANNLTSRGVTSFDISTVANFVGTVVTTADASGRKGRSITNALGQLVRVDEPTGIGGTADADLGALGSPLQPTVYTYDLYGRMVRVQQGVQNRYFKYDTLGRLIRVSQPEQEPNASLAMSDPYNTSWQWTAGFTYDVLGNVITATDAKNTVITNSYDRANRVKTRTYNDGITPSVSFYYDGKGLASPQSPNFAKGKLTKIESTVSATLYSQFDNFGRLAQSSQITDGQTYTSSYQYNLSGALVEETYPSGRIVKNEFESDGDLLRVTSKKTGATVFNPYVSNFSYTASGGISQMRLGNGRWETAKFNNRMQVTELGLGSSAATASLWKVNYEYGELDSNGNVVTSKNTGNIARQTLTIPGTSFIQSYKYDSLYRLTEAVEKTGTTQNWIQNWGYDRYGNRSSFSQNIAGNTNAPNLTIDPSTNRFVTAGTNFQYDLNGNLIQDQESRQFTFNGDNKQTVVRDAANNVIGQYFYDGEGKRVRKVTNTETTVFVYSSGKLIAEYSTQLASQPSINYTTTDHLGSPRVITDAFGQVKSRRDFLPFGEDLSMNVGGRSESLKYGSTSDDIKQKFTGYLKDNETGLDFAEARMYENRHARFTAVDPLLASGKSPRPQSFNRYTYVRNNPIILTDPSGLCDTMNCPRNYGGTVYTKTIDGKVRYNNDNKDGSWTEFTGRDSFIREGTTTLMHVDSTGWYEAPILSATTPQSQGDPRIAALLGGFSGGYNDVGTGTARGIGNTGIDLVNGVTGLIWSGTMNGQFSANPLQIERYNYDSLRQARWGTAFQAGLNVAPSVAGGALAGGSSALSVVPEANALRVGSALESGANFSTNGANLSQHLRQFERYGQAGFKEMHNGSFRYYGNVKPATKTAEMQGARFVREWNPSTSSSRSWYETLDQAGRIRQVHPKYNNLPHYTFDSTGKFTGSW